MSPEKVPNVTLLSKVRAKESISGKHGRYDSALNENRTFLGRRGLGQHVYGVTSPFLYTPDLL